MLRGDGSYPFDGNKWEMVLSIKQEMAEELAQGQVMNKEFVLIPRWEGDFAYGDWSRTRERDKKYTGDKQYFPDALAVYKHDFHWWLIRRKA